MSTDELFDEKFLNSAVAVISRTTFGLTHTVTEERETYFKRSRTKDIEIVFFSHLINNNHLLQVTAKPLRK